MPDSVSDRPRVVISGMGALTPLGPLPDFWENLKAGRSGIRTITQVETENINIKIAAEVDFVSNGHIEHKAARRMSRSAQMALIAGKTALADAGLSRESLEPEGDRVAVVVGTVNAGFGLLVSTALNFRFHNRTPMPTALINGLPNMPGHYLSAEAGATGPLTTITVACASGTQAIGAAAELLRTGKADVVITSGVDCLILPEVLAAFDAMTVLAHRNDAPAEASRPFEAQRDGFVMGEGAGVMVLETLDHAKARGARLYAEVLGQAVSSDANHSAAPDTDGRGAQKAMRWALEDARINLEDVDYINAHGTATMVNDAMETVAIKSLFGEHAYNIPISSTKSMIGHCMGGSGMLEAIASVYTIREGVVHPTINYDTPDPACDLDYVPNEARDVPVRRVLSNSFGLGGQNACIVLGEI